MTTFGQNLFIIILNNVDDIILSELTSLHHFYIKIYITELFRHVAIFVLLCIQNAKVI